MYYECVLTAWIDLDSPQEEPCTVIENACIPRPPFLNWASTRHIPTISSDSGTNLVVRSCERCGRSSILSGWGEVGCPPTFRWKLCLESYLDLNIMYGVNRKVERLPSFGKQEGSFLFFSILVFIRILWWDARKFANRLDLTIGCLGVGMWTVFT